MKKILALLMFPALLHAQTNASYIIFDHSNAGNNGHMNCGNSAPNVWTNNGNFGDGSPSISYSTVSNRWVVSGLSAGEWTLGGSANPTEGTAIQLYNASGAITGYYTNYYLTFYGFPQPALTNWVSVSKNYWQVPGDAVVFRASGRNLSSGANSNQLIVTVDGNPVFTGPWTAAAGFGWNLSGHVQWDGTNLNYSGTFNSGDSNTPSASDFGIITNATVGTNTWQWLVNGDTNGLTFDGATITAARSPSNDSATHAFGTSALTGSTIAVTNAITGAPGSSVIVTNLGTGVAAVLQFTIPQGAPGAPGTNYVTVNQFTNVVLSTIYPSNTWNLVTITNQMPNFSIWTGNSNGLALVTISVSNGVVRYLQVLR